MHGRCPERCSERCWLDHSADIAASPCLPPSHWLKTAPGPLSRPPIGPALPSAVVCSSCRAAPTSPGFSPQSPGGLSQSRDPGPAVCLSLSPASSDLLSVSSDLLSVSSDLIPTSTDLSSPVTSYQPPLTSRQPLVTSQLPPGDLSEASSDL